MSHGFEHDSHDLYNIHYKHLKAKAARLHNDDLLEKVDSHHKLSKIGNKPSKLHGFVGGKRHNKKGFGKAKKGSHHSKKPHANVRKNSVHKKSHDNHSEKKKHLKQGKNANKIVLVKYDVMIGFQIFFEIFDIII